jgi:predicted metallopeptidase
MKVFLVILWMFSAYSLNKRAQILDCKLQHDAIAKKSMEAVFETRIKFVYKWLQRKQSTASVRFASGFLKKLKIKKDSNSLMSVAVFKYLGEKLKHLSCNEKLELNYILERLLWYDFQSLVSNYENSTNSSVLVTHPIVSSVYSRYR